MKLQQHIEFKSAGIGNRLLNDYISGNRELISLYEFTPDMDGIRKAVEQRKNFPVDRKTLYSVLHRQHATNPVTDEQRENLDLLLQENTFTVTTGHQLNLMTGPLYFIYKIASAISLSNRLNEEMPGYHFVPVYWMNSEDHDFAEINHVYYSGSKFEWNQHFEKFPPSGRLSTDGLNDVLTNIDTVLASRLADKDLLDFIYYSYQQSDTLSRAHRSIVNKLFGEFGLVILDQDAPELKADFKPFLINEITKGTSFQQVSSTNARLKELGYEPQVYLREINCFYITDHSRDRILSDDNGYYTIDKSKAWSTEELIDEINRMPENFSPNVVTRPLYQEVILPDVAYIGGGAEVAYWLQYKSNFNHSKVFYPVILLRDSFLLLPEKRLNKLNQLGYSLTDLFKPIEDLINDYIRKFHSADFDLSGGIDSIRAKYDEILARVVSVDPSLDSMVNASSQKALNELRRIEDKLKKSLKEKNEQQLKLLRSLHDAIFPGSEFQERRLNIFDQPVPANEFISSIVGCADCLDARVKVLAY